VSFPPDRGRRRKLRRIRVAAALGLAAIVAALSGFSYWEHTRFPAHTVALNRVPVALRVQDGVSRRDLRAVKDGLLITDRFMRKTLRRTVQGPVEARVAHGSGCRPYESPTEGSIGEADDGFFCIATKNLHWQWLIEKDFRTAVSVSGHEYVHVLQAELGCLPHGKDRTLRWLVEGMADEIAWRALVADRRVSERHVERTISDDAVRVRGLRDRGLGPLSAYERGNGADREYALWHLAVRRLLRAAVTDGAAPRARPEISLRRFCERVGAGVGWRTAFARSFGESVGEFYAQFEAFRRRIAHSA
jgi:hypothetical protein